MDIQRLTWIANRVMPMRIRRPIASSLMRLINWRRHGDPYFFRAVSIEISRWCNRACVYCPNHLFETPREFMPQDVFDLALQRMAEIGWRGFVDYIFYNEPLADPRLVSLVQQTKRVLPRALPRILSNGDLLTRDLAARLIEAGVTHFIITRHLPERAGWRESIRSLVREWPRYFTVLDSPGQVRWTNRGGLVTPEGFEPFTTCDAPENSLVISLNGDVVLCCNDYHREHVVGNIREKTLLDIWQTPWFAQLRKDVRQGVAKLPICKSCFGLSTPVRPPPKTAVLRHSPGGESASAL